MNILIIRALSLFIVAFLNFCLALVLWYKYEKDKSKLWLGFTALFSGFYAFFSGAVYFFWGQNLNISVFWYKTTWLGIFILPCFVIFTYYFTRNTKSLKSKSTIMFIVAFVIIYLVFKTDLFVKSLKLDGFNISSLTGSIDPIGRMYIFLCLTIAMVNLLRNYFKATGFKKLQLKYFILGTTIFSVSGVISTSVVPLIIKESPYYDIAAYFSFIWIGLTSYAILKYNLMNIRVITTELFSFALWITLLIRIFFSEGNQDLFINTFVFLLVVFFGILLIRSVIKEVRQREEIAQMAEDVKRAYIIEKRAKEELEQLDKVKDQFLMTAQHNLRTPLTSIMGYSDLMLNGTFGKQNKKTTEVVGKLQILAQGMIKMVNNFLDMAQFQLGKGVVNLKPGVEIRPILEEIVGELKFKAESKGISLNLDASEPVSAVSADREKLKAALFNIIDNAVKYTNRGSVVVKIKKETSSASGRQIPKIKIIVEDTGIGIPKEKLSGLFEAQFERSEAAKRIALVGSGVGLYLAGQIIKAHNGRVWAESPAHAPRAGGEGEEKGSAFFVELPIK